MASKLTGKHQSKVPQMFESFFELLNVCPHVWIKSNGVTYKLRGSKWTLSMTSEGELNPQTRPQAFR